jgi:hypothetical protein
MKPFWIVIACLIFAALFFATNVRIPLQTQAAVFGKLGFYLTSAVLVAIIWAILFRAQVEKFQISIYSMFVLVLLQATMLLAIHIVSPFWAM